MFVVLVRMKTHKETTTVYLQALSTNWPPYAEVYGRKWFCNKAKLGAQSNYCFWDDKSTNQWYDKVE